MLSFSPTKEFLSQALRCRDNQFTEELISEAARVKSETVGNKVYLRALIEMSNICRKDCLYCGVRCSNTHAQRYELSEEEVLECASQALNLNFGSICIQAGERSDIKFTDKVSRIIKSVKELSQGKLGITLSLGEQPKEVLQNWFEAGAHRYLLRIEASNPLLYRKLHPQDKVHLYESRLQTLHELKEIGYQIGSGVMIGLPGQSEDDLADDLLFLRDIDVDMVGMGPYIPHHQTPLASLPFPEDQRRLELSIKMVALLRLLMKDINIAATTALEVLDPRGREKAIRAGANIVMPNLSPAASRGKYNLYEGKPMLSESIELEGVEIGYGQWGDSLHFFAK